MGYFRVLYTLSITGKKRAVKLEDPGPLSATAMHQDERA